MIELIPCPDCGRECRASDEGEAGVVYCKRMKGCRYAISRKTLKIAVEQHNSTGQKCEDDTKEVAELKADVYQAESFSSRLRLELNKANKGIRRLKEGKRRAVHHSEIVMEKVSIEFNKLIETADELGEIAEGEKDYISQLLEEAIKNVVHEREIKSKSNEH